MPVLAAVVLAWTRTPASTSAYLIAAVLYITGLCIRIWAQTHLHYRLGVEMVFISSGPFAFMRNPIYLANTLMAAGLVIASGIIWMLPILLCACAVSYSLAVKFEETGLAEKFGDQYLRYKANVPRWFPRWAGWHEFILSREYLLPSIKTEMYNLLFPLPLIVRALDIFSNVHLS